MRAYAIDQVRQERDGAVSGAVLRRLLLWYLRMSDRALAMIVPSARHFSLAACWSEAAEILADFADPAAERLRDRVARSRERSGHQPDP
ncbi:hypothetical protein [Saccharopolyspora sp. 5N708]|uniref:hypothetical protein n=1 Tax=Saccharopolyspora sp. 5N708 TaxID=3457424 RepID=UPI003FD13A36